MPEGDALHRAARRLQVLVGQQLEVETPHPRAAVKQLAPRLDGLRLEHVEAIGKNLLLRFEGGLVLRSHLRMKGRWLVFRRDAPIFGRPWLVLRGDEYVGAMFNGAVLELDKGIARRLGPDILAEPPDYDTILERLHAENPQRQVGDALLDQRLVAGIGNLWKAESPLARACLAVAPPRRSHRRRAPRHTRSSASPDARPPRRSARQRAGLSPQRPAVPPLRHGDQVVAAGRRRTHGLLVSGVPERRGTEDGVSQLVIVRAPQLHESLRAFALGSFRALLQELERGADLPFAFEEHSSYDRPALYEYRPLVKPFIEAHAHTLRRRPDAELAVDELRREPAAAIFARAHAGPRADEHEALFGSVLLPLLMSTAESCGGFDWDDAAFDRAYVELESALFGEGHQYGAIAPVIGITTGGATIELGNGIRIRAAGTGELAKLWPEANGLLPMDFGRSPTASTCSTRTFLEPARLSRRTLPANSPTRSLRSGWRPLRRLRRDPCSSNGSTGGRTASGRSSRSPRHNRRGADAARLVPRRPRYESARATRARGRRSGARRGARPLGAVALPGGPFQAEQLRESLAALLGGNDGLWAAAVRGAILLGDTPRARSELQDRLTGDPDLDAIRRALVEVLLHRDRAELLASLDESILGLRPRPVTTAEIPTAEFG